ncbi:MAG: hypothetical protein QOH67_2648 [Hyphomicrobiales bacterium]|jgi:hypothetical protein|nr:hypothetical protein [Hyphomicrobiales bacterium]
MSKYTGGCQCGKVRYEVSLELGEVIACNCSRCGRLGSLLAFTPAENFKLISGEGETTEYQFNKHVIDHLFCSSCGIQSFARGTQKGVEMVAINARCLDGVEPETLKVRHVNGRAF